MRNSLTRVTLTALYLLLILAASPSWGDEHYDGGEAYRILNGFSEAYPEKAGTVVFVDGKWEIVIGGKRFLWADGRLLARDLLAVKDRYTSHPFYPYPPELPTISEPTPERKRAIEERVARREENPPTRYPGIYNSIWRISDESSAWRQAKTLFFFGKKILVHRDLLDELAAIEEELAHRMTFDRELARYIESLSVVEGYSWRPIAGTSSLSYHSYGVAIDFLPGDTGGKETYWRWAMDRHDEWYILPYEKRLMPPPAFVRAFEKRGFIWGGKWFYFDTMHFEYRPEILALNGYTRTAELNPVTGILEFVWTPPR